MFYGFGDNPLPGTIIAVVVVVVVIITVVFIAPGESCTEEFVLRKSVMGDYS